MILIAAHGPEHEHEIPSNVPNEDRSHNTTELSYAEELEVQNLGECEGEEIVAEQPSEIPPEHLSKDDHTDEVDYTVQLGESRGEWLGPAAF